MPIFGQTNTADWFESGKELYDQGKYEEAIKAYDKSINASNNAIMMNPNNVEARHSLAQTWENKGQALDRQDKYAKANEAFAMAKS